MNILIKILNKICKSTVETLEKSQSYFDEIFDGTKDTNFSKYYSFMFIMRKALIIMFMLFLPSLNIIIKVGFFVLIQSLYYLYLVSVRPLEILKDNLIGVINETLILLLANMLFKYNKKPDWTSTSETVFFMSISFTNLIVWIIWISKYEFCYNHSFSWLDNNTNKIMNKTKKQSWIKIKAFKQLCNYSFDLLHTKTLIVIFFSK